MLITEEIVKYNQASADLLTIMESSNDKLVLRDKTLDYMLKHKIISLNSYTWAELKAISTEGRAQELFAIGDTKLITIKDKIYTVVLVAFDRERITFEEGTEEYNSYNNGTGLAGMTFNLYEIYEDFIQFEGLNINTYPYSESMINSNLNNYMKESLEADLSENITDVLRHYDSEDKPYSIYLPTEREILGTNEFGKDDEEYFNQLPYFVDYPNRVKKFTSDSKTGCYWTGTKAIMNNTSYVYINRNGFSNYTKALSTQVGVSFCFNI